METRGDYFDGKTSACQSVRLALKDHLLEFNGRELNFVWPISQVQLAAPLGKLRRTLYLPDGGRCDIASDAFARRLEQLQGKNGFFSGLHRWESSLKLALIALLLTIGLILGFIQFGIPGLADRAARAIPPEAEIRLGQETLQALDRTLVNPSQLPEPRQQELQHLFNVVLQTLAASERPYRLELRSSERIGANAFALPGGTVILTDQLVELAEEDEEIAAVLAHEVGHVQQRHAMRQVLQNSAVGLIVASLSGDVFSAASMAAALPTMLVNAKFSRDMELEADDVAVSYLQQRGFTVRYFATILQRLESAYATKHGGTADTGRTASYFASHPATEERIARLNAASDRHDVFSGE